MPGYLPELLISYCPSAGKLGLSFPKTIRTERVLGSRWASGTYRSNFPFAFGFTVGLKILLVPEEMCDDY